MSSIVNPLDPDPNVRMEALGQLRSACPITRLGADGPWLGLSHEVVSAGLRRVNDFAGSAGQKGLSEEDKTIAGILEPRHTQIRRIINAVVAFHKSQRIADYLEELIAGLLDTLLQSAAHAGPGGLDVMPLFADPIPPAAIARLLGFPEEDSKRYYAWANQLAERFAAAAAQGVSISMVEACPEASTYVEGQIDARLQMPQDEWPQDALTRFLVSEVEGERLGRRAITTQVMFLIGAGSETTRNLIGNMLYRLALDPELYRRIRNDRSLVEAVVEEALRLDPPAQFMARDCLAEAELGGELLEVGERVLLSLSSANTDPLVFTDPGSFDITRQNRDHVSFGAGPHVCPGAALARLEARLALAALVQRVEKIGLGAGYHYEHARTGMLHGPRRLLLSLSGA